jgi:hypothetical protein
VRDRAAWVALAGRGGAEPEAAANAGWPESVQSPAAVAEALSTAFTILPAEEIEGLWRHCPGLSAWLILEPAEEGRAAPALVHLAASRPAAG